MDQALDVVEARGVVAHEGVREAEEEDREAGAQEAALCERARVAA